MKIADFDFRVWNKIGETLIYASKDWRLRLGFSNPLQENGESEVSMVVYYDGEPQYSDICEIEPWSGLTDSEGVKIYEGDIVGHWRWGGQVEFGGGSFWVRAKNGFCAPFSTLLKDGKLKVIGNIHENADLLEKWEGACR